MNVNYEGSVAQRYMTSRTGLQSVDTAIVEPFNSVVLYIPQDLAETNIEGVTEDNPGGYSAEKVTDEKPFVQAITVDNFQKALKGELLAQWSPAFRDASNFELIIYLVVFAIPESPELFNGKVTNKPNSMDYAPLTKAFELTKTFGFFKMLFLENYNLDAPKGAVYDHRYLQLALSYQCSLDSVMSGCLVQLSAQFQNKPGTDNKIYTDKPETEIKTANPESEETYKTAFWGNLKAMNCTNTWLLVHSEGYSKETPTSARNIFPIILAQWFVSPNASGEYLGNRLSKVRLTGVKPTGMPSVLDSEVNTNLPLAVAQVLDSKNISYLMSISDVTENDSIVNDELCIDGKPLTAIGISKYIDYRTSMDLANWVTSRSTTTRPVLKNEDTYKKVEQILYRNLRKFTGNGKISDIKLNFPSYAALPDSKTDIIVNAAWTAKYISDVRKIEISGTITY